MAPTTLDALTRLRAALDQLARALAAGRSDAVLSAEEPIVAAVSRLLASARRDVTRSPDLGRAILDTRLALARCRALGQSAAEFARASLPQGPYSRAGLHVVTAPRRSVDSRT